MNKKGPIYFYLRHKKVLFDLSQRIRQSSKVFLFLDYDGTLTPIRKKPSQAVLSKEAKNLLTQLSSFVDVHVSIVTGRSMKNIRRLVPLHTLGFAANHGLHILFKDETEWIHMEALASIRQLAEVRDKLRKALRGVPNASVEDKDLTLSVHYRNCVPRQVPSLKNIVTNAVHSLDPTLRITKGKKVLEIRPQTVWGKKWAVLELLKESSSTEQPLSIYIGDDATDEEAFQMVRKRGIAVHVGKSKKTAAQYYVKDVAEVLYFLKLILMIRTPAIPQSVLYK
jgi:trehalose 6-phosphate phosphatase